MTVGHYIEKVFLTSQILHVASEKKSWYTETNYVKKELPKLLKQR